MATLAVILLVVVGGYYLIPRSRTRPQRNPETEISRLALGDQEKVERLIDAERRRDPHADRATLIRRALDRWRNDLRQ